MEAAASLTALIALSLQSTKFVYQTIESFREGPSVVQKLVASSKDLEAVLQQLDRLIQYGRHAGDAQDAGIWKALEQKVSQCSKDMQEASESIKTLDLGDSKHHVNRAWKRAKIPLKEKVLERFSHQVQKHLSELGLQLNIINSHLAISRDALQGSRHGASQAALHNVTGQLGVVEMSLTRLTTELSTADRNNGQRSSQTHDSLQEITSHIVDGLQKHEQRFEQDAHRIADSISTRIGNVQEMSTTQYEVMIDLLHQIQGSLESGSTDPKSVSSQSSISGSESTDNRDSEAESVFSAAIDRLCLLASRTKKVYHSAEADKIIDDLELVLNTILNRGVSDSYKISGCQKDKCPDDYKAHDALRAIKRVRGILKASCAVEIGEGDARQTDVQRRRKKSRHLTKVYESTDCTAVVSIKTYACIESMQRLRNNMIPVRSLDVLHGNIAILPRNRVKRAKISASFIQHITSSGFNSLNPLLSFRPIVPDNAPIFSAVGAGDLERMRKLFTAGEASLHDCDSEGRSLLNYAICGQKYISVRFLVDHGADVNSLERDIYYDSLYAHPLNYSLSYDYCLNQDQLSTSLAIRQCLLESGADPFSQFHISERVYSVFEDILSGSPADIVAATLKHGKEYVDLEERDEYGRSYLLRMLDDFHPFRPRHNRVGNDILQNLRILFTHGADVAMKDSNGRGCLHTWVCWNGSKSSCLHGYNTTRVRSIFVDVLCLLIDRGADLYAVDDEGMSVTEFAHYCQRGEYWELALEKCGFNVEQVYLNDHNNGRNSSNDIYAPTLDRARQRGAFDAAYHGLTDEEGRWTFRIIDDSDTDSEESEDSSSRSDDCSEGEDEESSSNLKSGPTDASEDLMDKADEYSDFYEEMGGVSVAEDGSLEQRGRPWML